MTKTIKQWLSELPEPYRTEALHNLEVCPWYGPEAASDSLSEALSTGFWWDCTKQGLDYWLAIYIRARAGEFDIKPTTMKKQTTKKRVKKPTQLDRIEADLKTLSAIVEGMKQPKEEAKESVDKEPEPWKPKAGDYFVPTHRINGWPYWNDKMEALIGSVRRVEGFQPEDRGGTKTIGCAEWDWNVRCIRPATPEEIAAAETKEKEHAEADKLSKLKLGVKVSTPHGEGLYWCPSPIKNIDRHFVLFSGGASKGLTLSDITIIK